jgi:hypothetical protein
MAGPLWGGGRAQAPTFSKTCLESEHAPILDLRRGPGFARMDRLAIGPQVCNLPHNGTCFQRYWRQRMAPPHKPECRGSDSVRT